MDVTSPGTTPFNNENHHAPPADQTTDPSSPTTTPSTVPSTTSTTPATKTPVEQGLLLCATMFERLTIDETVYLVPAKWYSAFNLWSRGAGAAPGPVDPAMSLVDADGVLLDDLIEERDWVVVNQQGWDMIKQ
jgi:hypothetical protein